MSLFFSRDCLRFCAWFPICVSGTEIECRTLKTHQWVGGIDTPGHLHGREGWISKVMQSHILWKCTGPNFTSLVNTNMKTTTTTKRYDYENFVRFLPGICSVSLILAELVADLHLEAHIFFFSFTHHHVCNQRKFFTPCTMYVISANSMTGSHK